MRDMIEMLDAWSFMQYNYCSNSKLSKKAIIVVHPSFLELSRHARPKKNPNFRTK